MNKLFVYGTLQDPEVQLSIFGRKISSSDARLVGYKKGKVEINKRIYPIAQYDETSMLSGKLLEIDNDEILQADKYETEAYKRIKVTLEDGQDAWLYCQPNDK